MTLPINITIQDRHPNFRTEDKQLYLVRCFACDPVLGRENYAMIVASGICAYCGWVDSCQHETSVSSEEPAICLTHC